MTFSVSESEIYKLENFVIGNSLNLPPETYENIGAIQALVGKRGVLYAPNDGGTAEAKLFRPDDRDE